MAAREKRDPDSGFTLIEVLISLALFALIGIAGFSIVDAMLRVQDRTDGRLERMAELQRAMHLMTLDFEQLADGVFLFDGEAVAIRRAASSRADGVVSVRYDLNDGTVRRTVVGSFGAEVAEQRLIRDVAALRWSFYRRGTGWDSAWPPAEDDRAGPPDAVAANLDLTGDSLTGTLRRVIRLPASATQ